MSNFYILYINTIMSGIYKYAGEEKRNLIKKERSLETEDGKIYCESSFISLLLGILKNNWNSLETNLVLQFSMPSFSF